MRLRKLGSTQSIAFFAPPEVHQSIMDLQNKSHGDYLDSSDVVYWLLEQTCSVNEQLQPLYFAQGIDFCRRAHAALAYSGFLNNPEHRSMYLNVLEQPERQTLEQLYRPRLNSKTSTSTESLFPRLHTFMKELRMRQQGFHANLTTLHGSVLEEVEQEREVAIQVEEVRQIQKQVHFEALSFPGLHPTIRHFAQTGKLATSEGYEPAFMALQRTELGRKYGIRLAAVSSRLYVSTEFSRTVKLRKGRRNDNFLVSREL